jgi:UDP-N-acetylglucosamine--N-acetylmuramyl-(pentapeptide) pyrophosphoryl-undecaprenol N-acetylglucosamine transferase
MKILIAVSGTGGHVYPGIALAEELRARHPDLSILFAAASGKPGPDWIRQAGFSVKTVPIRGVARRPSLAWLTLPFWLAAGFAAVFSLLSSEGPDLVVGTGGYVSGPFIAFASMMRIPTLVLEQNSIAGVATRLGSIVAREVHVTFPETLEQLPRKNRAVVSGNPVRRSIEQGDARTFRRAHGLPEGSPLVLVLGGSQGARAVTQAAIDAARHLGEDAKILMLIQTGAKNFEEAKGRGKGAPSWLRIVPFVQDMGGAYAASDLVLGRAGATTLAELAAAGIPSILVPFPFAAKDHQTTNAMRLEAEGAARVIAERDLDAAQLAGTIRELLGNRELLSRMREAVRRAGNAGARERVAAACERLLGIG